VFECQRCGQCCQERESVAVSIADLERWGRDLTLPSLYPYLRIEVSNDFIQISLKRNEDDEVGQKKGCPLYDAENKLCNIYFSMPLFCKSFPLGYDGERYFIKDKSCPGLGKGSMTREGLKEARDVAKKDFDSRVSTALVLPAVHGLVLKFVMEQSRKQVEGLSDEQKERLREILGEGIRQND
jgi:Fe-S-cluster containining protein